MPHTSKWLRHGARFASVPVVRQRYKVRKTSPQTPEARRRIEWRTCVLVSAHVDCVVFALLATWQLPHRCSRDGSTWNLRSETGSFSGPPAEDGRPHLHPDLRTDRSWRPRSLCGGGGIVPQLSPTGISCPCDLAASPKASITFMALARANGLATKRSPLQFRTSGRRCMTAVMYSPLAGKRRA